MPARRRRARAAGAPDDMETQGWWGATQAKLLARRGQFPAALRLVAEAKTLIPPATWTRLTAHLQMTKPRYTGSPGPATRPQPACTRRCGSIKTGTPRL